MNLFLLQQADQKLDQAAQRIREIQTIIADSSDHDSANQAFESALRQKSEAEHAVYEVEEKIRITTIKMQQSESSLYSGKINNPKELQDLQTEIALLKKHITQLEETEFDRMVILEEKTSAEKRASEILSEADTRKADQKTVLLAEIESIQPIIDRVSSEKAALVATLDPVSMETYLRLRRTKAGIAVTQVEDNQCEKCGAEVTQAEWQKARISQELCFCATCGRIIYAK